jgi:hypothetical protein
LKKGKEDQTFHSVYFSVSMRVEEDVQTVDESRRWREERREAFHSIRDEKRIEETEPLTVDESTKEGRKEGRITSFSLLNKTSSARGSVWGHLETNQLFCVF